MATMLGNSVVVVVVVVRTRVVIVVIIFCLNDEYISESQHGFCHDLA